MNIFYRIPRIFILLSSYILSLSMRGSFALLIIIVNLFILLSLLPVYYLNFITIRLLGRLRLWTNLREQFTIMIVRMYYRRSFEK